MRPAIRPARGVGGLDARLPLGRLIARMIVATKAKPIARSFRRALRRLAQRWRRGLRAALDDARDRGFRVVPICPFVEAYVRRHPEDADPVVADPARSQ